MRILRSWIACFTVTATAWTAQAQTVLFHEDFESGYANWSMTGLWNPEMSTDPCGNWSSGHLGSVFPSGTHCAYYGDSNCQYAMPPINSGALTLLVPTALPATGRATVRFWNARYAECFGISADVTTVEVSSNAGSTWVQVGQVCYSAEPMSGWHPFEYSLAAHAGQSILLRFHFDTVDGIDNHFLGWFLDDVSLLWDASSVVCPTSASFSCPCNNGNPHYVPYACANSTLRGGELVATGTASVSGDTLRLSTSALPASATVLFFQGTAKSAGVLFGDGRLCVSAPFVRLGQEVSSAGRASFPGVGDPSISAAGQVPALGGTRAYQAHYRDVAAWCSPATFNTSSAFELVWSP